MQLITEIINRTKFKEDDLIAVYPYGSRVYGNARKNSDYDFIVVTDKKTNEQYSDKLININFYTAKEHQERLDAHEISALECYFLPKIDVILEKRDFNFKLNLVVLRHSLSAKSSNSWVKAKKKLTVAQDYDLDLGRKSLFHAMRIVEFGRQIAVNGKIVDYAACNPLFEEIMNCYTWDQMFDEYKERYNTMCSIFRIHAPKQ